MFSCKSSLDEILSNEPPWKAIKLPGTIDVDKEKVIQICEAIFSIYMQESGNSFDRHRFLKKEDLDGDLLFLAEKAEEYVVEKLKQHNMERFIVKNQLPILKTDLSAVKKFAAAINFQNLILKKKDAFAQTPEMILPEDAGPQDYVDAFNTYPERCKELREETIATLERYKTQAWIYRGGVQVVPDEKEFVSKREAFFTFYKCDDHEIQEKALFYLTELLENDPLTMESAKGLVELLKNLMNESLIKNSEDLNVQLQYRLTKAYAIATECYTLQYFNGNLGTLTPETKEGVKKAAEDIESFNKQTHPGIHYWSCYAVQAAMRIETNETPVEKWFRDVALVFRVANNFMTVKDLAQDIVVGVTVDPMAFFNLPQDIVNIAGAAEGIWNDLFSVYNRITGPEYWFEKVLTLRKMCRYALHNSDSFKRVSQEFKKYKSNSDINSSLFYGLVTTLKYVALSSSNPDIQEEALKLIAQYLTVDDPFIESRVVMSLLKIAGSNKKSLSNTSYAILNLLHASGSLRFSESRELLEDFSELQTKEGKPPRKITKENIYLSTVIFFMKRIADINCELDYWRHCIPTLLATLLITANNDTIIPPLLRSIAIMFHENEKTNSLGFTLYHLALKRFGSETSVWRDEPYLLEHIRNSKLQIPINQKNCYGQAPIHLAAVGNCVLSLRYFLKILKADPNLRNKEGNTALHISVDLNKIEAARVLIYNNASLKSNNHKGFTPLRLAVEKEKTDFLDLFLKKYPDLYATAFKAAALAKKEKALKHLIEKKDGLDSVLAFQVLKMMSNYGTEANCSPEFAEFHIERCSKNRKYFRSFKLFSWPQPIEVKGRNITISPRERRKKSPTIGIGLDAFGYTLLMKRAKAKEDLKKLERLLKKSKRINRTNNFGQTALFIAVIHHNAEAVRIFRKYGADPNICDHDGANPLHMAVYTGNFSVLQALLEFPEKNLDQKNIHGDTPFLIACGKMEKRNFETHVSMSHINLMPFDELTESDIIIKELIEAGASPYKKDYDGNNGLHKAICYGSKAAVIYLTENYPKLFWQENKQGLIPIEVAILYNKTKSSKRLSRGNGQNNLIVAALTTITNGDLKKLDELIKKNRPIISLGNLLVKSGMNALFEKLLEAVPEAAPHKPQTFFGLPPLQAAVQCDEKGLATIQAYLKIGCSLDIKNNVKNTAAHLAAIFNNIKFLDELLKNGASVDPQNKAKQTPLHLAASHGNIDAITLLLSKGANKTKKDVDGRIPLLHAVVYNRVECAEALIKAGSDPLETDYYGNTCLHLACHYGFRELAVKIIELAPKCLHVLNRDKRLPLHEACIQGDLRLVKLLMKKYQKDPKCYEWTDVTGATPLHLATRQGHLALVGYFIIKRYGNILNKDFDNDTLLHAAAESGVSGSVSIILIQLLTTVLTKKMSLVKQSNVRGQRPLHRVGKRKVGDIDQEQILTNAIQLLEAGARLHAKDEMGTTFLHLICRNGFAYVLKGLQKYYFEKKLNVKHTVKHKLKPLLTNKIKYRIVNNKGNTMLHEACKGGHIAIIDLLLSHIKINKKNKDGLTPIMLSVTRGLFDVAQHLLNKGAKLKKKDELGRNIIHLILENEILSETGIEFLEQVIKKEPDLILGIDDKDRTTLHVLAEKGHEGALSIILRNVPGKKKEKANYFWAEDGKGETAMDIADFELSHRISSFDPKQLGELSHNPIFEPVHSLFH